MTHPRILRARRRERAFSTTQDVRRALFAARLRFADRMTRNDPPPPGSIYALRDPLDDRPLAWEFVHHWDACMNYLRDNPNKRSYWDFAMGALLRCAELCRLAGKMRATT